VTYTTGGTQYTIAVNNPSFSGYQATGDTGDVGEQALDIAQAIGMAPGISQVRVYTAPESFTSSGSYEYPAGSPGYDWDIFNAMATENACSQLSLSWHWEPENLSANDSLFEEFQAQGQSFFAASGDWGAFPTPADYYYPAEDNNVTAVGGTDLTTNGAGGAWSGETAWVYSSGGISPDYVTIPSYQQIAGVITSSNHGSTSYRNIPDVAMEANVDNYYCDHGSCSVEGGTSYAAPRWAAFMALANQQAKANGKSMVGFINPVVYPLGAGSNYTTYFHDITSGNNDCYTLAPSYCGSTTYYSAVTGYDLVTGWGSPNGSAMVNELASYAGSAPPSCTVTPQCVGSGNFANASITLSCTQAMQISTSATLCGLYGSGGCGTNNGASGILTYSNASYSGDTYSGGYCSVGWCWGGKCSSQRMTP
jgi:subtilase family serine protease